MTTEPVEKQDPTGKVLEIYAAAWMAVYMDVDRVKHNVPVRGRSGVSRQLDVCGERPEGIVVGEAKDHQKKKLEVGFVDAFIGKMQDVNGVAGVMFSPVGFSTGAKKRARVADPPIELVTLPHGRHVPDKTFWDVFCPSPSDCGSTVGWNFRVIRSESETQAGVCDRCGSVIIWCPVCEGASAVDSGDQTCACGLVYSVFQDHADDSSIEVTLIRQWRPLYT